MNIDRDFFTLCIDSVLCLCRVIIDSYQFLRYSVAQVASFHPPGAPVILYPFGRRTILFTSAKSCHEILSDPKHQHNYKTRFGMDTGLQELGMKNCGVIWNNDSILWTESRECFQKGLNSSTFKDVYQFSQQNVEEVMQAMPVDSSSGAIHMMNALRFITLNYTLVNLLGLPMIHKWDEAEEIIEAIVAYFKAWEFFLVRPSWFLTWKSERSIHRDAIKRLHEISEKMIIQYEKQTVSKREKHRSSCMWYAYSKFEQKKMSRTDLIQLTLEILLAGVDTSSVTMFYTLGYLAEHAEWYHRIHQEIIAAKNPADNKGKSLKLMKACINESMRLKPVGPIIMRKAKSDDEIDGTAIYPGNQIIIHLAAMNLHEVESAHEFDPTRFLASEKPSFGFCPFGDGPKGCVGRYLAMVEMLSTMYYLLRHYQVFTLHGDLMKSLATHWDIAQQPQKEEEMHMIKKPVPRKVFFIGPSSVGKTTMILQMQKKFPQAKIHTEVAREIMKVDGITREDLNVPAGAVEFQKKLVEKYAKLQQPSIELTDYHYLEIFDRSAIDALVYTKLLSDEKKQEDLISSPSFQNCLATYQDPKHTLVVVFPVVEAFRRDDDVRLLPSSLEEHLAEYHEFERMLKVLDIPHVKLDAGVNNRQSHMLDLIGSFLSD